ncbi:MAG: tyrosine-type recombinase/integrase [Proteobacteria bacterium]|nr:tyrosine-type recombinase/integrase [Pseudomonadota bacterium]MBU4259830.1 tyrosine-type recombinase/integrase [Pseudomonadota bacterium]MBU4287758.1 tyrosine-type recombinase/integrase [Pseudomonadota bacterium]MBU4414330.1 tyrosine-type recombinase/integrase [Pseudomonadota bacterium]
MPVVLSREEIETILTYLAPPYDLIVKLLYGCGLRLFECLQLRVHCLNFDMVSISLKLVFSTISDALFRLNPTTFAIISCVHPRRFIRRITVFRPASDF